MWHEDLETFWDGSNHLAIGLGNSAVADIPASGHFGIGVLAAVHEGRPLALIAVIEPLDTPLPWYLVCLPPENRFVRLRRSDDPDGTNDITLILVPEPPKGGSEWRVAIAQVGGDKLFHFDSRPGAIAEDEATRRATGQIDTSLLWGGVQRRLIQRRPNSTRYQIGPARLFWPLESRIGIASNISVPAKYDVRPPRHDENQPAIYSKLRVDKPPEIRLRIFLGSTGRLDDAFLRRVVLVHVMHQRRHFDAMNALRRKNSRPVVESLALDQLLRELPQLRGAHSAVPATGNVTGVNLATALRDPKQAADHGFEIPEAPTAGGGIDVEFYNAALGDDIGLVSNAAAEGDLLVRDNDPGGYPGVRLFRVTDHGLEPHPVDLESHPEDKTEKWVADVMEYAASLEEWSAKPAAPLDQVSGYWKDFCRQLALPETRERTDHALSESIGLLILAAWSNALAARSDERRLEEMDSIFESLKAFRTGPALVSALAAHRGPLLGQLPRPLPTPTETRHFIHCYAECIGSPELVARDLDPQAEFEAWQVLADPDLSRKLLRAKVTLSGTASDIRDKHRVVVDQLHDEMHIEEIAESYEEQKKTHEFQALRSYLARRRVGGWFSLLEAFELAAHCKLSEDQDQEVKVAVLLPGSAEVENPRERDSRSFEVLLAEVNRLIEAGLDLPLVRNQVKMIAGELEKLKGRNALTRKRLRFFEAQLLGLVSSHLNDQLTDEVVEAIETWAQVPDFLEKMASRIRRGGASGPRRKRELVQDYVNRVKRGVPKLGADANSFNSLRRDLGTRITSKLAPSGSGGVERERLADDLTQYADILLHHCAFCRIRDLVSEAENTSGLAHTASEIRLQLSAWPHRAAETWGRALSLAEEKQAAIGKPNSAPLLALPAL